MLPTDIISIVVTYLGFLDCFQARLTCKQYSTIKQNSILSSLIRLVNAKMGFDKKSNFGKELMQIIKKYPELSLGGSSLIEIINEEIYENSDIDIYLNNSNYNFKGREEVDNKISLYESEPYLTLENLFKTHNLMVNKGFHTIYRIDGYYVKTVECEDHIGGKIEIVANPHEDLTRVTKYRDFSFCNNFYDGKVLYIENLDSIVNKWGTYDYNEDVIKTIDFDLYSGPFDHVYERALKYCNRGFDVYIDLKACWALSDPDLYTKCKERKSINKIEECFLGENDYVYIDRYENTITIYPENSFYESDTIIHLAIDENYPDYAHVNTRKIQDGKESKVYGDWDENWDISSEDEEEYYKPIDKWDL